LRVVGWGSRRRQKARPKSKRPAALRWRAVDPGEE
jgi:hypothetical protein